ncbi:hypothetical protein N7492_004239 [Penicillium capsulatum]|uniref:Peptidase S8/S53 domain-containing protein n=1 Tax=Penicillium capsulatum TaxID=69766 RepID=A0A9W9I9W4_9EURO|nr:hypothetical protein N7492_004239 [Penicillium capsulatum]KAJ6136642.1 hypothetical protein N7512_001802 [Penicillium capsulatum]
MISLPFFQFIICLIFAIGAIVIDAYPAQNRSNIFQIDDNTNTATTEGPISLLKPRDLLDDDTEAPQLAFISNNKLGNPPSPFKYRRDQSEGQGVTIFILDDGLNIDLPEFDQSDREVRGYAVPITRDIDFFAPQTLLGIPNRFSHGVMVTALAAGKTLGPAPKSNIEFVKIYAETARGDSHPVTFLEMWEGGFQYVLKRVSELKKAGMVKCVVNMSQYSEKAPQAHRAEHWSKILHEFYGKLQEYGVVVVLAGGNEGLRKNEEGDYLNQSYNDFFQLEIGEQYDNVVTVGGLEGDGTLWPETLPRTLCGNEGATIYAPAVDLRRVLKTGDYEIADTFGTSLAAPVVTGTLAYFLGINAEKPPDTYKSLVDKIYSDNKVDATALVQYMIDISHKSTKVLGENVGELPYEPPTELRVLYNGAGGV